MKKIDEFMAAWERNFTRMGTDYAQDARDAALEVYGDEPEVGGEMPAPWPGMGVEWKRGEDTPSVMFIAEPYTYRGRVLLGAVGSPVPDPNDLAFDDPDILAIYDGRCCIWRRKE